MNFTNLFGFRLIIAALLIFCLSSCATGTKKSPVFSDEELADMNEEDQALFSQALQNSKKNPKQAIETWESYLEKHSQSFAAYNNMGVAHIYNNSLKLAIRAFKKSIKIHSTTRAKRNLIWTERRWANLREKAWAKLRDKEEPLKIPEEVGEIKTYKPLEETIPEGKSIDEDRFVVHQEGMDILDSPDITITKEADENLIFRLTRKEATIIGLQRDFDLSVEFINPQIQSAAISKQLSDFDPTITSSLKQDANTTKDTSSFAVDTATTTINHTLASQVTQKYYPGTTLTLKYDWARAQTKPQSGDSDEIFSSDIILEAKQSLLRNFGIDINTTKINLAKNQRKQSVTDFVNRAIQVVANIQNTYWDLQFNIANLKVRQQSLKLNENLYKRKKREVEIGALAPLQLTTIEADMAAKRSDIISAERQLIQAEINFKKALNLPFNFHGKTYQVLPLDLPQVDNIQVNRDKFLEKAIRNRPDLNKLILTRESRMMDLRFNENQLLPDLSLSGNLGWISKKNAFGKSLPPVERGDRGQHEVKLEVSYPIYNRSAKSDLVTKKLELQQTDINIRKKKQEIFADISLALTTVDKNYKLYLAAKESTRLEKKKLQAEEKKLRFGLNLIRDILDAQNTLTNQQLSLLQSEINYQKSLTDLYLKQGLFEPVLNIGIPDIKKNFEK